MKIQFTFLMLAMTAIVFLPGCESDDESPQEYKSGVLVVNEGGFGAGTGTVVHYDPSSGATHDNIFKNAQGFAGDVLQSITLTGDRAYLVLNGDNKIEIADPVTFSSEETFTAPALVMPRYVEIIDDKAFISVWGEYDDNYSLVDSYVLVVDPETLAVLDTIDTDEGVENMAYNGGYLFASNNNFGYSSTLAVIDPEDNSLVDQIDLSSGPAGMVFDKNGKLWVVTEGTYQGNDGMLFRVNPTTLKVEDEFDFAANPGVDLGITPDKDSIFYTLGNNVYKMSVEADALPGEEWIEGTDIVNLYALGVDPVSGEVYVGDARDNATAGLVYVYKTNGGLKTSFTTGISPTQFVFIP